MIAVSNINPIPIASITINQSRYAIGRLLNTAALDAFSQANNRYGDKSHIERNAVYPTVACSVIR